jgi:hypothetical protein
VLFKKPWFKFPRASLFASLFIALQLILVTKPGFLSFMAILIDIFIGWILLADAFDPDQVRFFLKDLVRNSVRLALVIGLLAAGLFYYFPISSVGLFPGASSSGGVIGLGGGSEIFPGQNEQVSPTNRSAFVVKTETQIPEDQLYWRASTLSATLDGMHWFNPESILIKESDSKNPIQQKFFLHEHPSTIPIGLDAPDQIQVMTENLILAHSSPTLSNHRAPRLSESRRFQMRDESLVIALRNLQTSENLNEFKMRDQILNWFARDFTYTLSPGKLAAPPLSNFLLKERKGYCEHFAAAFSTVMRSQGIPSRVVIGYRGGVWNPYSKSYRVNQNDAHAWSEFWSPQESRWIRVDPTLSVKNFEPGLTLEKPSKTILVAEAIFTEIRFHLEENPSAALGIILTVIFSPLAILSWNSRKRLTADEKVEQIYAKLCLKMAANGHPKASHLGPDAYFRQLLKAFPDQRSSLESFHQTYLRLAYSKTIIDEPAIQNLKKIMNQIFSRAE